jgi:hypothetical protein
MRRYCVAVFGVASFAALLLLGAARTTAGEEAKGDKKLVPLDLKLPLPMYRGTPKIIKLSEHIRKPSDKPRPAFLVPEGTQLISLKKPVTSSDEQPIVGDLAQVTDGDKDGGDGSYVELGPKKQWVQIDLKGTFTISAIVIWHFHGEPRVYHDVVVQLADDPDFINNVRTLFNNDFDNSSGLGIGKDLEYFESNQGEVIDGKGEKAGFVRLYSNGNTASDMNHYVEVEVYGIPAK